jgi:hypothetical protein
MLLDNTPNLCFWPPNIIKFLILLKRLKRAQCLNQTLINPFESLNFRLSLFWLIATTQGLECFQFLIALLFTHQKIPFLSKTKLVLNFTLIFIHIYMNITKAVENFELGYPIMWKMDPVQSLLQVLTYYHLISI